MVVSPIEHLPVPPKPRKQSKLRGMSETTDLSFADDAEYLPRATRTRTRPITPIELAPVSTRVPLQVASIAPAAYAPPPPKRAELIIRCNSLPRLIYDPVRASPLHDSPASSPPELSFDDDDSVATASEFSSPPPPSSRPTKPTWDLPCVTSPSFQDRLATWAQNRFPEADLRSRASEDLLVKPVW
jgi:hypothetical protein